MLLAQTRRGYGNLSHWITVARRRAEKGSYVAHPGDVEGKVPNAPMLAGLPECLALLVPAAAQPFEDVFAHAMWLKTWFQDRAAIALELLHRAGDDDLVDTVVRVAQFTGLPIVAAGDVLMHVRSRKPLQDTLTATRLARPVAECGFALEPNAEQHLRSRGRLAALYQPEWLENTMVFAGRCSFSLGELKYEYPQEIVPAGETPASWLQEARRGRRARSASRTACPEAYRQQIERRARASSPSSSTRPTSSPSPTSSPGRARRRSSARAAAAPPTRSSATACTSPRSTRAARRCCSAASSASSATSRPTSTSTSSTSAARR